MGLLRHRVAIALCLLATGWQAVAQDAVEDEEGTICLPTKSIWRGSIDEIRLIEQVPVPERFRKASGGGCGGFADPLDLVKWHLRYGSEASISAALRFVEDRHGKIETWVKPFEKDLLHEIKSIRQNYLVAKDAFVESRKFKTSDEYDRAVEEFDRKYGAGHTVAQNLFYRKFRPWAFIERAHLYRQAAERFESRALAQKAHAAFAPYHQITERLAREAEDADNPAFLKEVLLNLMDDALSGITPMRIELDLALLDADLEPSEANVAALAKTIDKFGSDSFKFAGKLAFSHGDDFCDFDEDKVRNDYERNFRTACSDNNWFEVDAINYIYALDRLALLRSEHSHPNVYAFLEIYRKDSKDNGNWGSNFGQADDRFIAMKMAIAHFWAVKADSPIPVGERRSEWQRRQYFGQAMQGYIEAARLFNPASNPVMFRKIAGKVIALNAQIEKFGDDGWTLDADTRQDVAFIKHILNGLDLMVLGQIQ